MSVDIQRAWHADDSDAFQPQDVDIQQWAQCALEQTSAEHKQDIAELTVRIVGTEESAQLNETYRHKQGPTNVLSFPFEKPAQVELPLLGDLVVCAPVVAQQAKDQYKTTKAHWAHMVVHGTLHLLGYDHQDASAAERMEGIEINILNKLGFPNPYQHIEENERSTQQ